MSSETVGFRLGRHVPECERQEFAGVGLRGLPGGRAHVRRQPRGDARRIGERVIDGEIVEQEVEGVLFVEFNFQREVEDEVLLFIRVEAARVVIIEQVTPVLHGGMVVGREPERLDQPARFGAREKPDQMRRQTHRLIVTIERVMIDAKTQGHKNVGRARQPRSGCVALHG